jgi:peroxiredoxin
MGRCTNRCLNNFSEEVFFNQKNRKMSKKTLKNNLTKKTLRVISRTKQSVNVLLPSLDTPIEMTHKYFNYLKSTGAYMIIYCVAL